MNRAALGCGWLADRLEAAAFVARVGEVCLALPIDLHAYCVLPRHYHVLARAELSPLLDALAELESESGLQAEATTRSVPVAFGRHLMSVSRYIHLNPVDAGLVWYPEHWPYSSFRSYLGGPPAPRFLSTQAVLGRFGTVGARHRHRAYVYAGLDPGTRDRDGRPRWSALFPAGSTASDLAWRIEPVVTQRPRHPQPDPGRDPAASLHALARSVAATFGVSADALRSVRTGGAAAALARGAFVHAARAEGIHRLADVAAFMGYASPAVAAAAAERFDRARHLDRKLAAAVTSLSSPGPPAPRPARSASPGSKWGKPT